MTDHAHESEREPRRDPVDLPAHVSEEAWPNILPTRTVAEGVKPLGKSPDFNAAGLGEIDPGL